MDKGSILKSGKYKVYPNGYVYVGDTFKFIIEDDRVFDYVRDGGWKKDKRMLSSLLDGYPESFEFLKSATLGDGFKDTINLGAEVNVSLSVPPPMTLNEKLSLIAGSSWSDRSFRDSAFADALLLILERTEK